MEIKLQDAELKVMDVLWKEGDCPARHVAQVIADTYGWNINTTYTLIKRCIKKEAIERTEPNFMCHVLIGKETVQVQEATELINKVFDGSAEMLFTALLNHKTLSDEEVTRLKKMVNDLK